MELRLNCAKQVDESRQLRHNCAMKSTFEVELRQQMARYPNGASLEEIGSEIAPTIPRRTLQRQLAELCEGGVLFRSGRARATKYHLVVMKPRPVVNYFETAKDLSDIIIREDPSERIGSLSKPESDKANRVPFSSEAEEVRKRIRIPLQQRPAVGYQRKFLESYQPNVTQYLPKTLRDHLRVIGQTAEMAKMPLGTYAANVLSRLLVDLSWNSSRLEGNTYSLLETDLLLEQGNTEDPVRAVESRMILNHKQAIEFLVERPSELGYNRYTFLNLHSLLMEGLFPSIASEGRLRTTMVGIHGTSYRPEGTPTVVEECFDLIMQKVAAIEDELEQAFFLMVHLPYLQPFEDGNKRCSRLAANIPLIRGNLSPLSFVDVATRDYVDGILGVYELNRIEPLRDVFAWAYERSARRYTAVSQQMEAPDPIAVRYREEIKSCVRHVVVGLMGKAAAARAVRQWANKEVTHDDLPRFIELTEMQLLNLNENRIVRMRLRPSEFAVWHPIWTAKE